MVDFKTMITALILAWISRLLKPEASVNMEVSVSYLTANTMSNSWMPCPNSTEMFFLLSVIMS